jgi:hypothetical protein
MSIISDLSSVYHPVTFGGDVQWDAPVYVMWSVPLACPAITDAFLRPPSCSDASDSIHVSHMASGHIQALLSPPSDADAHKRTGDYLNVRFKTFQDVESSDEFDELVANAHTRDEELKSKVRSAVIV